VEVTISIEDYLLLKKYYHFCRNWAPCIDVCPKCGAFNPRGYVCIHCNYGGEGDDITLEENKKFTEHFEERIMDTEILEPEDITFC
jgi:ribosomal protein L32